MEKAQASANIGFEKQIWDAACVLRGIWTHLNIKVLYWIEFGSTTYIIIDYEK